MNAVPCCYANATKQTLPGYDGCLTKAQEKEKSAASGNKHRTTCKRTKSGLHRLLLVRNNFSDFLDCELLDINISIAFLNLAKLRFVAI